MLDYIAQYDAYSCQSACIAMVTGDRNVKGIRECLLKKGEPGNPYIMGEYLKPRASVYEFTETASIADMATWLGQGFRLITHGYFSGSGHVVVVSDRRNDCFLIDDPFGEFDAASWSYTDNEDGNDVPYSERLIYSACVASHSRDEAIAAYQAGGINRTFGNAWVHKIKQLPE